MVKKYVFVVLDIENSYYLCRKISNFVFFMGFSCFKCGHELVLESNSMLSDFEDVESCDDYMITYASCPYCGAQYEFTDTADSEKSNYPYWNNLEIDK